MSGKGLLPEEVLEGKLKAARRAEGSDAKGFVELVDFMQRLEHLGDAKAEEGAGLRLLGELMHAAAATPFTLVARDDLLLRLARACSNFVQVVEPAQSGHPEATIAYPAHMLSAAGLPDWMWPSTNAATVLQAAGAAFCLVGMGQGQFEAAGNISSRLVEELGKAPAAAAVQAELQAMQSPARVADILYVAHSVLAHCAKPAAAAACMAEGYTADAAAGPPLSAGAQQAFSRWKRAAVGMTAAHPQQPAAYQECVGACMRSGAWAQAAQWAERGIAAADAAGNLYYGASLRYDLGSALIVKANRTQEGMRAGRLRRLLAEAQEREARVKAWVPKKFLSEIGAGTLKMSVASIAAVRDDDMVTFNRQGGPPPTRPDKLCAGCGARLLEARLCAGCRKVAYCSAACQKQHWPQHKAACRAAAAAGAGRQGSSPGGQR